MKRHFLTGEQKHQIAVELHLNPDKYTNCYSYKEAARLMSESIGAYVTRANIESLMEAASLQTQYHESRKVASQTRHDIDALTEQMNNALKTLDELLDDHENRIEALEKKS
jgi:hypothetical protein